MPFFFLPFPRSPPCSGRTYSSQLRSGNKTPEIDIWMYFCAWLWSWSLIKCLISYLKTFALFQMDMVVIIFAFTSHTYFLILPIQA